MALFNIEFGKKISVFILIVLLLGVVGVLLTQVLKNEAPVPVITVIQEYGELAYKVKGSESFQKMEGSELSIQGRVTLVTAEDSSFIVLLPDNSIVSLGEKTEIEFDLSEEKFSMIQIAGKSWHRVRELQNGNEYNVTTGDTIAAVRGTIFSVNTENIKLSVTEVFVIESKVDVQTCDKKTFELITTERFASIDNTTGECIEKFEEISDEFYSSEWYLSNTKLDKLFKSTDNNDIDVKQIRETFEDSAQVAQDSETNVNEPEKDELVEEVIVPEPKPIVTPPTPVQTEDVQGVQDSHIPQTPIVESQVVLSMEIDNFNGVSWVENGDDNFTSYKILCLPVGSTLELTLQNSSICGITQPGVTNYYITRAPLGNQEYKIAICKFDENINNCLYISNVLRLWLK